MAEPKKTVRKPRIRKTAPTVRQRVEAAQIEASREKPRRIRKVLRRAPNPFRRLHLPNNKAFGILRKLGRGIRKVLSWLMPRYFINAWRELRQVVWPSRKETWRLTLAVFIFAIVFGALVAGVDKGLDEIFKKLVLK